MTALRVTLDRAGGTATVGGVVYALTPSRSVAGLWHVWIGDGSRRRPFGIVRRGAITLTARTGRTPQARLDVAALRALA